MQSIWAVVTIAYYDIRESLGSFASVFSVIFTASMSLVVIAIILSSFGASYEEKLAYLYPGLLGLQCLSCLSVISGKLQNDMTNGTFVIMLLSPSTSRTLILGHIFGAIVRVLVQAVALFIVASIVLGRPVAACSWGIAIALWAVVMGVVIFGSCGVLLRAVFSGLSQTLLVIIMSFGSIGSTAYYTRDRIPERLLPIAEANPVTYMCDSMRLGLYADRGAAGYWAVAALTVMALVAIVLALTSAGILDRQTKGV